MKISKDQDAAAIEAYKIYFDSYIGGDVNAIAAMLNDDYTQIGSAESEVFFNKQEALQFLNQTIGQVAGRAEIRNRVIKSEWLREYVMVIDLFDMYVRAEDAWIFYSKFRASTLMEYKDEQWRFVHQHSSVPDVRTDEGDNIAIEKISAENLQLRDAIKRRTIELEQKNRELEIETSLEKIRSSALSMHEPDDMLEVCRIIAEQLRILGVEEIRNVQTVIINEPESQYVNYQYFVPYDEKVTEVVDYRKNETVNAFVNQMLTAADAFFSKSFEGNELADWVQYRKDTHQLPDPKLEQASSAHYYFYSIGVGALGVSTYRPLVEESLNVFKRFRNVFDLAYRRYDDIKIAERQTREARIEVALERIRAKALAMQKSHDILDVANVMRDQMRSLGQPELESCLIHLYKEEIEEIESWYAYRPPEQSAGEIITGTSHVSADACEWTREVMNRYRSDESEYTIVSTGTKIQGWYKTLEIIAPDVVDYDEKGQLIIPEILYYHFSKFSGGALLMIANTEASTETCEMLQRAAIVFELAYTRFIDLQKAEEQTREAQIELALERVRAKAMAMQKSDELRELVAVIYDQLRQVGFTYGACGIVIMDESSGDMDWWMSGFGKEDYPESYHIPYFEHRFYLEQLNYWKEGKKFAVMEVSGEEKKTYDEVIFNHSEFSRISPEARRIMTGFEKIIFSNAYMKHGALSWGTEPLADEDAKILQRFAIVFEQSYTRFLDLLKAEAQAREAHIEAALERVRARSMAMLHSEELKEVISLLLAEIRKLDIPAEHAGFYIDYKQRDDWHIWLADPNQIPFELTVPYFDCLVWHNYNNAKEQGLDAFAYAYSFEEKNDFYEKMFRLFSIPEEALTFYLNCPGLSVSTVLLDNVGLYVENFSRTPYTEEENRIVKRFGKVFQQTYTRFLDLQRAEEQTREAEIQLALERVRARAMAMHSSQELKEVVHELRKQMGILGQDNLETCVIHLHDESPDFIQSWAGISPPDSGGEILESTARVPKKGLLIIEEALAAYTAGRQEYVIINEGEKLKRWFSFLEKESPEGYNKIKSSVHGNIEDMRAYWSFADFAGGSLLMVTLDEPDEATRELLRRFSQVFGLAYRRFADLKQAEAQAREAQIEAALERVRSRTMAMQKSNELPEAANLLFHQVQQLGMPAWSAGYCTWNDDQRNSVTLWMSSEGVLQPPFTAPTIQDVLFIEMRKGAETGKALHVVDMGGEALAQHYQYMRTLPVVGRILDSIIEAGHPLPTYQIMHQAYFSKGFLLFITYQPVPEAHDIFKRFAAVFDQTYTRFLDLQKAEAQAREAKIEGALERVRSKSISMRKSEEIADIAAKIFSEMRQLDLHLNRVLIWTFNDTEKYTTWWSSNPEVESTADSYRIDYNNTPAFLNYLEAWHQRKPIHLYTLAGEVKSSFEDYLFAHTEMAKLPTAVKNGMRSETNLYTVSIISDYGIMMSGSLEPLSDLSIDIIQRFGRVFQQSYTRYLDVQKAEAQAREAQIQLALERVRARSMAMQHSDELAEVSYLLNKQVVELGIPTRGCAFNIYNEYDSTEWFSNLEGTLPAYKTPRENVFLKYYEAGQQGETLMIEAFGKERIRQHYEYLFSLGYFGNPEHKDEVMAKVMPESQVDHAAFFKYGYLLFITLEPAPEAHDIFKRFAKEFEQTYTRFLDLKKAEAQAREALIEAALEKVRSRSLAMHKSEEIKDVVKTVVERIRELDIEMNGGVSLVTFVPESKDLLHWIWIPEQFDEPLKAHLPFFDHVMFHDCNEARMKGLELVAKTYSGEEKASYFDHIFNHTGFNVIPDEVKSWCLAQDWFGFSFAIQKHSGIFLNDYTGKFFSAETNDILIRFSKVFEQSFIRFLDLQKAEFQTHQAKIETALEKVRARALAMQQPEELTEVAQVMRNEMGLLGVEALETSSIYIHEEGSDQAECWYAIKDILEPEKKLVADHFLLNLNDTWVGRQMFDFYQSTEKYISIPMRGTNRKEWINYCSERSKLLDGFYGDNIPERTYHLYKFSNGTIGAATPGNISAESWDLLQRAASVFSLAYSRFKDLTQARNDLQKLKEAKLRAEVALAELQTTQKQLIQAEKLASLGQLTAGIAHEIQNPLNFVNNFSDVNAELLSELKEEIGRGSTGDAVMLIEDILENEKKINHHGKRADAIVKGMLQHSQPTTGNNALTVVNELVDEYVKLSFHAFRGKDITFDVNLQTVLDPEIGALKLAPQEIGRALLNILNNAFYAVNERKRKDPAFSPEVIVQTRKADESVEISIRDNGGGIPEDIVNKIFQPFFTTKPTGQGTGLGLSLAYDIVKAHGGELKVETKAGMSCEFKVLLPTT